ncbi:FAD-binding oxidoreductase [bacterium]|nr:FAD-binding oxidoreductase [bacterium]
MDIDRLKSIVGEDYVREDIADLYIYGSDASVHHAMPQVVVKPGSIEEIREIARYANSEGIAIVARGAGSGMSGHAVPLKGGIVLDMKRMNHILEIKPEDMYCRVEPGVIDDDLNRALKPFGLTFPPSPASSRIATIGGEIGNNASGIRSVKYGATRDYVLGMKVVLADGELVNLGARTRVEAAGYQIHRLMVGSEGTLGIIVEATLKLIPLPKFRCLGVSTFDKLEDAGNAIADIISSGSEPSMLELMDDIAISAVNTTLNLGLPEVEAIIFFEADGKVKEAVDFEIENMKTICEKHNGTITATSYDAKERTKYFSGRKKLFAALSKYKEGYACTSLADDMAVPYSKMAECARKIHDIAEKNGVIMTAYGHCGSGVMHTKILMNPNDKEKWEGAQRAVEEIYNYVDSVGGVTSGEHGIAISKAPAWKKARPDLMKVMSKIKKALDPNNILNPNKLMDAPDNWYTATQIRYDVKK